MGRKFTSRRKCGKMSCSFLNLSEEITFTYGMTKVKALKLFQSKRHQSLPQY